MDFHLLGEIIIVKLQLRASSPTVIVLLFCLWNTNTAAADSIYTFTLPANGAISALSIQITEPALLPSDGLLIIPVTDPIVTLLIFPTTGFSPAASVIGIQITSTTTLIGVNLVDTGTVPLLLTVNFPSNFFMFSRTPTDVGTFLSFSGNVVSLRTLSTSAPTAALTVTSMTTVPEPSTLTLLGFSLIGIACLYRLRKHMV